MEQKYNGFGRRGNESRDAWSVGALRGPPGPLIYTPVWKWGAKLAPRGNRVDEEELHQREKRKQPCIGGKSKFWISVQIHQSVELTKLRLLCGCWCHFLHLCQVRRERRSRRASRVSPLMASDMPVLRPPAGASQWVAGTSRTSCFWFTTPEVKGLLVRTS